MNSTEQRAIREAREANNAALRVRNAQQVADNYLESFFLLTSTNGFFQGKQTVANIYQTVFTTRENVLFVRTPNAIAVNNDWNMASEKGSWVGTWIVNGENIQVAGDYYAKWHKVDGTWKLKCEVYTQLACQGDVVCNNKPNLL
jgi:ketosteroid isomerase-like protein